MNLYLYYIKHFINQKVPEKIFFISSCVVYNAFKICKALYRFRGFLFFIIYSVFTIQFYYAIICY